MNTCIDLTFIVVHKISAKMADECKTTNIPSPAHFVLVHGACHGGWSWYKIRCLLESTGQKVSCPDLSSSGTDRTDADTIFTFQDYNKPLDDLLASLPKNEKVSVLVSSYSIDTLCLYIGKGNIGIGVIWIMT